MTMSLVCGVPWLDNADEFLSANLDCSGSAGLHPCRHHPPAAIVISLSMATQAQEEADQRDVLHG
jgi:hypothetical protein